MAAGNKSFWDYFDTAARTAGDILRTPAPTAPAAPPAAAATKQINPMPIILGAVALVLVLVFALRR